jgi:hypothetical protein
MGASGQRNAPAALYSRNGSLVPNAQEAGWVGVRAGLDTGQRKETFASAGDRTPVLQSVVKHYTKLPQLLFWCDTSTCRPTYKVNNRVLMATSGTKRGRKRTMDNIT